MNMTKTMENYLKARRDHEEAQLAHIKSQRVLDAAMATNTETYRWLTAARNAYQQAAQEIVV